MKINGRLIYLTGVILVILAVLLYLKVLDSDSFCMMMGVILGYYYGNERAIVKIQKSEKIGGSD